MGLLIRTPGTNYIIDTLNLAFEYSSDGTSGLQKLQTKAGTYPNFTQFGQTIANRNWEPSVIAISLGLLPYDPSGNIDGGHKRRWIYFLQHVVGDKSAKADGSVPYNTIFKPLRNALADAILNRDSNGNPLKDSNGNPVILVRVAFDHVELDDISNTGNDTANAKLTPNIVIFDLPWPDPNGQTHSPPWFIRHITLFTQRVDKSQ